MIVIYWMKSTSLTAIQPFSQAEECAPSLSLNSEQHSTIRQHSKHLLHFQSKRTAWCVCALTCAYFHLLSNPDFVNLSINKAIIGRETQRIRRCRVLPATNSVHNEFINLMIEQDTTVLETNSTLKGTEWWTPYSNNFILNKLRTEITSLTMKCVHKPHKEVVWYARAKSHDNNGVQRWSCFVQKVPPIKNCVKDFGRQ